MLLQAAPARLDLPALRSDIASIDGVVDVHDLHVWTLTSEMDVVTAHLVVTAGTETHGVLDRAGSYWRRAMASPMRRFRWNRTIIAAAMS